MSCHCQCVMQFKVCHVVTTAMLNKSRMTVRSRASPDYHHSLHCVNQHDVATRVLHLIH
jgi:hypothetical protein